MKLKKPTMLKPTVEKEAPKKRGANKLPPDAYKDEIVPVEFEVDENRKIVLSVKRGGELGLPCVDVRTYQTTEVYTGFTKKGINIPIEFLPALMESLQTVLERSEKKSLLDK